MSVIFMKLSKIKCFLFLFFISHSLKLEQVGHVCKRGPTSTGSDPITDSYWDLSLSSPHH